MSERDSFRRSMDDWLAVYNELFATLDAIPPDRRESPPVCGEWNARQVVAHLAGWHYEAIRRFSAFTAGELGDKTYDEDAFNALQVEARAHLDWDLTVDDLREVFDILRMQSRDVATATASEEPRYGDWLRGLAQDARHHLPQLRTLVPVDVA